MHVTIHKVSNRQRWDVRNAGRVTLGAIREDISEPVRRYYADDALQSALGAVIPASPRLIEVKAGVLTAAKARRWPIVRLRRRAEED